MTEEQKKDLEQEKNKNNPNYNPEKPEQEGKGKKNKKQKKKDKVVKELDFSMCDFPLPYSRQDLVQNWYQFNDSTVTPIQPGVLQSKFGGNNHDGNAYMLVYRQKTLQTQS